MKATLEPYFKKRDFAQTSEPRGGKASAGARSFVVQKHAASRLHYDFRLELDGTLKSWAVPKGPSLDPADKRMAVHVEDHPIDYGRFEGTIPKGQYGAGTVIVWDNGVWEPVGDPRAGYLAGKLKFRLHGKKLGGGWTLVRMHGRADERQEPWLLIKERDDAARPAGEYSVVEAEPGSVLSDLTIPDAPAASAKQAAADDSKAKKKAAPTNDVTAEKTAPTNAARKPLPKNGPSAKESAPKNGRATATAHALKSASAPAAPSGQTPPEGARKAALPAMLAPQLATLVAQPPSEGRWIYEIKFDGYRLLARVDGDDVRLITRNGNDWSSRMPGLVEAVRDLALGSAWLDGEIVVAGADGAPDFNLLQNAFDSAHTERIQYCVFDLPFHDGCDLRNVALVERRARLGALLDKATPERVRFSEDFSTSPAELLNNACRMRLEGVIGKRADAPYVAGRSASWIKLKCTQRQEFVVGGWTEPKGTHTGVGSLLLGIHDEAGDLRFAGAVGSGFDAKTLSALRKSLDALAADASPFTPKPRGVKGHWVRPKLVAEVSFGEWTPDGRIRHAVFHGLRDDKPAQSITREQPVATKTIEAAADAETVRTTSKQAPTVEEAAAKKASRKAATKASGKTTTATKASTRGKVAAGDTVVEGMRISHPERVIDASTGLTKLDVVNHYLAVARLILPHLVGRPVSLVRAPSGIGGQLFFQRHAESLKIPDLKRLSPDVAPGRDAMVEVDSFTALIGSAQMNVIEFHTWNATTRRPDKPDRLIFDLDPGEGVAWPQMQQGAELLRSFLAELGLTGFLKTSGGKGLHVDVPITPKEDWDTVKALAKAIVEHLAEVVADRFVAKSGPRNRVGKIFIDYLRNGFAATTACAWSARARPGLGVSVPCAWDELMSVTSGAHWTIANAHERIEEKADPWRDYAKSRRSLAQAMTALGVAA